MDPLLTLNARRLSVDPGGEARVEVTVRNPGELVEQYRIQVLGVAGRWTQVVPRDVSVLPDRAEVATVVFRPPPAPAAPAGEVPFGVRCSSLDRRDNCAVVEGDLFVSAVLDLAAAVLPVGADGGVKGRYRLDLTNTGTLAITAGVGIVDAAELLRFAYAPAEVTIEPRATASVFIQVRARSSRLTGKPVDHPFTVTYVAPESDTAGELSAVFRQRAVIRRWMLVLLLLAVLTSVVVGAFLVVRPGADPGPALTTGAPPASGTVGVAPLGPDRVTVTWDPSPYAVAYELHALRDGRDIVAPLVVEAPVVQAEWTVPGSGPTCFQLVVVGTGDQRSKRVPQTDLPCADLQGAVAASESAAAQSTSAAQAAADESSSASAAAVVAAEAARSAAEAAVSAASASQTAVAAGQFVPRRSWVVYYQTPVDGGLFDNAVAMQTALQAAGAPNVQLRDSTTFRTSPMSIPFYLVISDDFPDQAAARAECAARRAVPGVACTDEPPQG